ncbi:MAG: hypothetical protein II553_07905, partial [Lachnospiraceae bacterium]|nr:hypothetical protein [Lachnospiraceae bacterium]
MYYPRIQAGSQSRIVTDVFAGYNHNLKIADGISSANRSVPLELYDTQNMSTRRYPMLCPRKKRGTLYNTFTNLQAIIAKDALYWIDDGTLYANGLATELTGLKDPVGQTQRPRQM